MSKLSVQLKQSFKKFNTCRMAFFHLAFQYQEEVEAEGKIFSEEAKKLIPSFPLMDYLKFKPLIKILPERYILKLHDDGASKLHYYSSRSWFVDACSEIVKKKAYDYQSIDEVMSRFAKANRGPSRVREPSTTDKGLQRQLEQRDIKIAELEHELRIVRAENRKLKSENSKLKALSKRKRAIRNKFASVSTR